MTRTKLAVIGAGPKGLAIAAKASVWTELGLQAPEVHLFERHEVGAHWSGRNGFTNGRMELGTSPEKDLGFPYATDQFDSSLNDEINRRMQRYSWTSFLIATNAYSDWIDRGRPAPSHHDWSRYLAWAFDRLQTVPGNTFLHRGDVRSTRLGSDGWQIHFMPHGVADEQLHRAADDSPQEMSADGLVLTGPGLPRPLLQTDSHPHLFDLDSFWRQPLRRAQIEDKRIAIVGAGENAASVALALIEASGDTAQIEIITPLGSAYSRAENFYENRVYSNPATVDWANLRIEDRREFVRRTDLGVFSQAAMRLLNTRGTATTVPGRAMRVHAVSNERLSLEVAYNGRQQNSEFDYVILANGFDQAEMLKRLLDENSRTELLQRCGLTDLSAATLETQIGCSLELQGLTPRLHLPMLAGLSQGPGFANLSSLGRLSDRILSAYLNGVPT